MSKAKQKGTAAESAFLKNEQVKAMFPDVARRALTGALDQGDIGGCGNLVFEVKNQKTYSIPAWLKETEVERVNAKAEFGFLIVKPNGVGLDSVGDWWMISKVTDGLDLLRLAGYSLDIDYGR